MFKKCFKNLKKVSKNFKMFQKLKYVSKIFKIARVKMF